MLTLISAIFSVALLYMIYLMMFLFAVIIGILTIPLGSVWSVFYWKAYISVRKSWPYDKKSTRRLWAYGVVASLGISAMLSFVFLRISGALGFYILWPPSVLIVEWIIVAFVTATYLHKYWTDGAVENIMFALKSSPAPAVQVSPAVQEVIEKAAQKATERIEEIHEAAVASVIEKSKEPPVETDVVKE